jgi:hypothetical protein
MVAMTILVAKKYKEDTFFNFYQCITNITRPNLAPLLLALCVFRKSANMEFLDGMTVNERLFALKKMDSFDQAIVSGNKEVAIKILEACELSNETAKSTVKEILKSPKVLVTL